MLAQCQASLGQGQAALDSAHQLVRLAPEDDRSHALAGRALLAQGRPEAAVPAFTEALRLNPHSFEHLHNRALALHRPTAADPSA